MTTTLQVNCPVEKPRLQAGSPDITRDEGQAGFFAVFAALMVPPSGNLAGLAGKNMGDMPENQGEVQLMPQDSNRPAKGRMGMLQLTAEEIPEAQESYLSPLALVLQGAGADGGLRETLLSGADSCVVCNGVVSNGVVYNDVKNSGIVSDGGVNNGILPNSAAANSEAIRSGITGTQGAAIAAAVTERIDLTVKAQLMTEAMGTGISQAARQENQGAEHIAATATATAGKAQGADLSLAAGGILAAGARPAVEPQAHPGGSQVQFAGNGQGEENLVAVQEMADGAISGGAINGGAKNGGANKEERKAGKDPEGAAVPEKIAFSTVMKSGEAGAKPVESAFHRELPAVNVKELPEKLPRIIQLHQDSSHGTKDLLIQLEPKDLGKLLVKLTEHEGTVSVRIVTDSQEARTAVENSIQSLRQSFQEQGIKFGTMEVEVGTWLMHQQGDRQPNWAYGGGTPARTWREGTYSDTEEEQAAGGPNSTVSGGIDYKV